MFSAVLMYFLQPGEGSCGKNISLEKFVSCCKFAHRLGRTKHLILMPANSLRLSVVDAGHEKRLQDRVWTKELPAISASG